MDADKINKKIEITWAAVDIYEEKGRVSIPDLVNKTKLSATEIYQLFPNKKAILAYFYPALVLQYWAMIEEIEDFEDYAISEKFSNFIYTMFDLMGEKQTFVNDTFDKYVFRIGSRSDFHEEATTLFKEFLTTDGNIAVSAGFFMGDLYYKTLSSQYLFLIKYWLNDTSTDKERTLALADKLSSLFEEIVYNKTIDKGFDLLKFVFGNNDMESWLPKLGEFTSNKEKEETDHTDEKEKIKMSDFPSSKFERSKIIAKTGIKVGSNYAQRYLKKKVLGKNENANEFHKSNANEIFKEFTKLRGTALKIAQGMSMDNGFLPEEFADVMSQAQYSVPPINKALVRTIIKRELGEYPEKIFTKFDAQAFAAASIGQVHKAELKDGRKVAVKIQYPNVRETINSDMMVAKSLAKRIIKKGSDIDPYFNEIKSTLIEETDYINEGAQIDEFRKRFGSDKIIIPEWIQEFSTEKVLTMTFIEGRHMGDFLKENPSQEERNHFGQMIWDFFHDEIRVGGAVHADTHPGNFLFTYDGKLGVIDFGCVKLFPEVFFKNYLKLLPTHLADDKEAIRNLYIKLDVINPDAQEQERELEYYHFARNYGIMFSKPYRYDTFNFDNPAYDDEIRHFTKEAPLSNELRGSKHFLYTSRVHTGLYSILIKMGSQIDTTWAKEVLSELLDMEFEQFKEPVEA